MGEPQAEIDEPREETILRLSQNAEELSNWLEKCLRRPAPPSWVSERLGERPVDLVENALRIAPSDDVRCRIGEAVSSLLERAYGKVNLFDDASRSYICQILRLVELTNRKDCFPAKSVFRLIWGLASNTRYCQGPCEYAPSEYAHLLRVLAQLQCYRSQPYRQELVGFWQSILDDHENPEAMQYAQAAFSGLRRVSIEAALYYLPRIRELAEENPHTFSLKDALSPLQDSLREKGLPEDLVAQVWEPFPWDQERIAVRDTHGHGESFVLLLIMRMLASGANLAGFRPPPPRSRSQSSSSSYCAKTGTFQARYQR